MRIVGGCTHAQTGFGDGTSEEVGAEDALPPIARLRAYPVSTQAKGLHRVATQAVSRHLRHLQQVRILGAGKALASIVEAFSEDAVAELEADVELVFYGLGRTGGEVGLEDGGF